MIEKSPTFKFWDTVLRMEFVGLIFVRAHREKTFLYIESLKSIVPWIFAFDHTHYARWLPIHIRDLENLPRSIIKECQEWSLGRF